MFASRSILIPLLLATNVAVCQKQSPPPSTETVEVTATVPIVVSVLQDEITAGDTFTFTVTLDKPPNFSGGFVQYAVAGPSHVKAINNCSTTPDPRKYLCGFLVPAIGPAGKWKVRSVYFIVGNKKIVLMPKPLDFRVLANPNVVLPTSAEVTINASQSQLLRNQAALLQERIQGLKSAILNYARANRSEDVPALLQRNLRDAMLGLATTESEFFEFTTVGDQKQNGEVFFSDLRASYEEALIDLDKSSVGAQIGQHIVLVSGQKPDGTTSGPLLAAALRPLEQNELAYNVVATAGSLTFDLEVTSNPPGAALSYHRRGDAWQINSNPTNSTIHSLPYAIWIVKVEKPGYKTEEREHDPFRESNHVITVELQH